MYRYMHIAEQCGRGYTASPLPISFHPYMFVLRYVHGVNMIINYLTDLPFLGLH
jgi:hypothetical protein